jgi:hypothetical protein
MYLTRYPKVTTIKSSRAALTELLVMAEFLQSPDYVVETLTMRHGVGVDDAHRRAKRISPHVKAALAFLEQAVSGPADVAFLPAYYGLLNLVKVYILSSRKHQALNQNRWHGAAYDVYRKTSRDLRTEEVTLHPQGAISLFYEVITSERIVAKTRLRMADIFPYIHNVGMEWSIASNSGSRFRLADFIVTTNPAATRRSLQVRVGHRHQMQSVNQRNLPILVNVRRRQTTPSAAVFEAAATYPLTAEDDEIIARHVRRELLYYPLGQYAQIPICSRRILMFEELPIVLAFFHLSSVARYNPELLARLRDSRFWPVISALRYHGVAKFMLLFWSYVQQELVTFE